MPASPGEALDIGSLHLQLYGVCVLLGFFVWVLVTARLWQRGGGDGIEAAWACLLAAPVAFIGARLYHVITDYGVYSANPTGIFDVAQGGLSIFGAVAGGIFALVFYANVRGWPIATFLDCAIVGIPLAQAIGRWGNYFNQELFGGPSTLPWAVVIDPAFRPAQYIDVTTFVPTFLYESLWNLGVFAVLMAVVIPRLWNRVRPGTIFAAYLVLYGLGRIWIETLRVDPAHVILGLRLNSWVFGAVVLLAGIYLIVSLRRRVPAPA